MASNGAGKVGARTKRKTMDTVAEIEAAMDGAKEREEERRKEALKGKDLLDTAMAERRKLVAQLRAERARTTELKEALKKKQAELIHVRQAITEATGGLDFEMVCKDGEKRTEIKDDISGVSLQS